jgi:phage portal protein BeeE
MLLGIPGDNTFANYAEANRTFFRQTVLPLASRVGASIAQWLSPQFGESIRVVIDTDRIDALAADRTALWDRVSNAAFLTLNEKREAGGTGRWRAGIGGSEKARKPSSLLFDRPKSVDEVAP